MDPKFLRGQTEADKDRELAIFAVHNTREVLMSAEVFKEHVKNSYKVKHQRDQARSNLMKVTKQAIHLGNQRNEYRAAYTKLKERTPLSLDEALTDQRLSQLEDVEDVLVDLDGDCDWDRLYSKENNNLQKLLE